MTKHRQQQGKASRTKRKTPSEQALLARAVTVVLRQYKKTFDLLAAYDRGEWSPES